MATLERAIQIATQAHHAAKDKAGGAYLLHPLAVMVRVRSDKEKIVAVLHDVVEDSIPPARWGIEELRAEGFAEDVLAALECVTKREGESYEAFILRSRDNTIARAVKIADLEENMDIRRLGSISDQDAARLNKYLKAWRLLTTDR